jgi:hypothetical protein
MGPSSYSDTAEKVQHKSTAKFGLRQQRKRKARGTVSLVLGAGAGGGPCGAADISGFLRDFSLLLIRDHRSAQNFIYIFFSIFAA